MKAKLSASSTTDNSESTHGPMYSYDLMPWHSPNFPEVKEVAFDELGEEDKIDIILFTATKVELEQVIYRTTHLPGRRKILRVRHKDETYYLGRFGAFRAAVMRCSMGSDGPGGAALASNAAIELWKPIALIAVGIAFGIDRLKQLPGDVLVATNIALYEGQRVARGKILRDPIPITSNTLLDRFRHTDDWVFKRPDGTRVKTHFGQILSGDKLVDNVKFKNELMKLRPAAIGGEMEGAGLSGATSRTGTNWILVKGVCDWADGQKNDNYQELAAASAASLCKHVLDDSNALHGLQRP